MLNVFTLANGRLFQEEIESLEELTRFKPIWVDLENPTTEERRWVKQHFGLSIPEDAMDEDIEESARFFEEDNGELHIRSDFLIDDAENPSAASDAFLDKHSPIDGRRLARVARGGAADARRAVDAAMPAAAAWGRVQAPVRGEVLGRVAVDERAGGQHLGIEQRVAAQLPVQIAAMAIGPAHHGGHRQAPGGNRKRHAPIIPA